RPCSAPGAGRGAGVGRWHRIRPPPPPAGTTMRPLNWASRGRFLAGAAVSFGMIIAAITIGGVLGLEACPLCIFQRVAFGALGVVFLLGALFAPSGPRGRGIWGLATFAAASVGIGIAGRHVWLQLFPVEVPTCGMPLSFMRETM